ncbi:MAG: DUF1015 family protein [Clostridiales bacterium]|jgi:uncharacterized protein (DUF1015 family)|nr:DUF1015 family protein [Clostridiales bacterium]
MAFIKAFRGVRPRRDLARLIAAPPYDVCSSAEARLMAAGNPHSFLHVDKAEIDLDETIGIYDDRVYEKARANFDWLVNSGAMVQDEKPSLYIYRLSLYERVQTGLVACTSVDECLNGLIKKHELTRKDKLLDRIKHVDALNANTGPIFLAYKEVSKDISEMLENWASSHEADYDFKAEYAATPEDAKFIPKGIRHEVWVISSEDAIQSIVKAYEDLPALYVADGHHRLASAAEVAKMRRERSGFNPEAESNFTLSVIFPHSQLAIMDYNRLVKDLNGLDEDAFLALLKKKFSVRDDAKGRAKPLSKHHFGLYMKSGWRMLALKDESSLDESDPERILDSSILQNLILEPILGIADVREDKRIDFSGGMRGLEELERRVDSGEMAAAFAMFPASMEELMAIADAGRIMPPKSTWFEPKLRSGLFVHLLD